MPHLKKLNFHHRTRKENLARAMEHEMDGNSAAAYECYQKAVDITPLIAHELIQVIVFLNCHAKIVRGCMNYIFHLTMNSF